MIICSGSSNPYFLFHGSFQRVVCSVVKVTIMPIAVPPVISSASSLASQKGQSRQFFAQLNSLQRQECFTVSTRVHNLQKVEFLHTFVWVCTLHEHMVQPSVHVVCANFCWLRTFPLLPSTKCTPNAHFLGPVEHTLYKPRNPDSLPVLLC
jgi:hypothetical protein